MFGAEENISINKQCNLLKINRNNFYYHPKSEVEENEKIIQLLRDQYAFTPFYGYRKMTVWLQKQGFLVNEKRVRRLHGRINGTQSKCAIVRIALGDNSGVIDQKT